jgi:hypothetical protein
MKGNRMNMVNTPETTVTGILARRSKAIKSYNNEMTTMVRDNTGSTNPVSDMSFGWIARTGRAIACEA